MLCYVYIALSSLTQKLCVFSREAILKGFHNIYHEWCININAGT